MKRRLNAGAADHVALLNPISPERSVMRRTLLPGLLAVAHENLKTADGVAMYELGFVYEPRAGEKLPDEPRRLAIVLGGRRSAGAWDDPQGVKPAQADFFDLKGVVEGARARPASGGRFVRRREVGRGCIRAARPSSMSTASRSARSANCIRRSRRTSASASAPSRSPNSISKRSSRPCPSASLQAVLDPPCRQARRGGDRPRRHAG